MPKETGPYSQRPNIGMCPDIATTKVHSQRHLLIAKALADRRKKKEEEDEVERGKRPSPASCWDRPGHFDSEKDSDCEEEARKPGALDANKKVPNNAGDTPQK